MPDRPARLVGGVSRCDDLRGIATLRVDRGLKSGVLDVIDLDEEQLARVVAEGAAILHRLARSRDRRDP
jgi:hypothetical protein